MSLSSLLYTESYRSWDKLMHHVVSRCEKQIDESDARRNAISSEEELISYVKDIRSKFTESFDDIQYDSSLPLNAKKFGIVRGEIFDIEKIIIQTRPSVYMTANLYMPHIRREPCGAVLFLPGHNIWGKAAAPCQRVARALASAGLIVLSIDSFGQGERFAYVDSETCDYLSDPCLFEHQQAGHQVMLTGKSPIRYFISDAKRAIDYLETREEVDKNKVGIIGSAGGGVITCNMMVCDSRIKAAIPASFVTSRREMLNAGLPQDAEQIWMGDENFKFDYPDVFACFAPKPCLILANDSGYYPIEGTIETFEFAKKCYSLHGACDNIEMFIDHSPHSFTRAFAAKASAFFARILNNEERTFIPSIIEPISEDELTCTKNKLIRLEYPDAKFIFDENLEELKQLSESLTLIDAAEFLRKKTYSFRNPAPLHVREYPLWNARNNSGIVEQTYFWFTQKWLPNYGFLFRDKHTLYEKQPIKVCLFEHGSNDIDRHEDLIYDFIKYGYAVLVLDISGFGKCRPEKYSSSMFGTFDVLSKNLFFIGDSIAAIRLYDLERLSEVIKTIPNIGDMSIYSDGDVGILASMYKLMHDDIEVEVNKSQSISDIVLNRIYDNDELAGYILPGIAPYAIKAGI